MKDKTVTEFVAQKIREKRKEKGFIYRKDFASYLNWHETHLARIESGIHCITVDTLFKISCALETPIEDFFPSKKNEKI